MRLGGIVASARLAAELAERAGPAQRAGIVGRGSDAIAVVGLDPPADTLGQIDAADRRRPIGEVGEHVFGQLLGGDPVTPGLAGAGLGAAAGVADPCERGRGDDDRRDQRERQRADRVPVLTQEPPHVIPRPVGVGGDQVAGLELPQVVGQLASVGVAIVALRRHRARDDRRQLGRRVGQPGELALARCAPGEQLRQHHAERVHVDALVDDLAARLLGRHEARRADHLAVAGRAAVGGAARRVGVAERGPRSPPQRRARGARRGPRS